MRIDKCPLCGGKLQATAHRQTWYDCPSLEFQPGNQHTTPLVAQIETEQWSEFGTETTDFTFYCEDDHSEREIAEALKGAA